MKKILLLLILISALHIQPIYAQQQYYDWQIGAGIGGMSYYGDLTYKLNAINISAPAYQFTLGRNISPSFALLFHTQFGQISGNDHAKDWGGDLRTENPDFTRALNFKTDIRNANLLLSYRLNNGKILSRHAAVGPYLFAGVGVTDFTVFGDLYNGQGQRYYYWSDNTVRNLPQNPANVQQAQVIGQDGNFETRLSGLETEKAYPTTALNIPVGAGVKFRISERLSANIQSTFNYAFTGYLDDVNGAYRNTYANELQAYAANPSGIMREMRGNNRNDMFISAVVSLNYHFNLKRKKFEAPMVYTGYQQPATAALQKSSTDTDANDPVEMQIDSIQSVAAPQLNTQSTRQPSVTKATPQTDTKPSTATRLTPENNRQTVDVNVRIFIEKGDAVTYEARPAQPAYSVSEQAIQTRPNLDRNNTLRTNLDTIGTDVSLRSVYNQAQINALKNELESLKREVELYRIQGDVNGSNTTIDSIGRNSSATPQQNVQPNKDRPKQSQQKVIQQQAPQQNNREALLNKRIDSLNNELRTLEAKPQQNARTDTYRSNPDAARQQQALRDNQERAQAQQYNYGREITQLRRELNDLRSEMNRRNYSDANAARQNYQAPPPNRTAVVTVPNALSQNRYDAQEMSQLRSELSDVKQKLNNLQAQQKTDGDTEVSNKIDSLLNMVTAIDRTQQLDTQPNNMDANTADADTTQESNQADNEMMDALRNQIISLNQSLGSMQNQLEEIESAPPPAPLSALGSTVVYYDIDKSVLKPDDKQRLSVLANKLQADNSILLSIRGYTDQTGNASYNLMLSRKRAENIRNYFVSEKGINADQILVNYFGQQSASDDASKNNPYDRKVELKLYRENFEK